MEQVPFAVDPLDVIRYEYQIHTELEDRCEREFAGWQALHNSAEFIRHLRQANKPSILKRLFP